MCLQTNNILDVYDNRQPIQRAHSANYLHHYRITSILTSSHAVFMHDNRTLTRTVTSTVNTTLSETSFIILLNTLTILLLLLCIGLFFLCRRHTRRHISPSFDSNSYIDANEHSLNMTIGSSKYELGQFQDDDHRFSSLPIEPISDCRQQQSIVSQSTVIDEKKRSHRKVKLKKKRIGHCCCTNTSRSSSRTINGRTRRNNNEG
jgi:hypothetical protein